jgi:hypothetical protein
LQQSTESPIQQKVEISLKYPKDIVLFCRSRLSSNGGDGGNERRPPETGGLRNC